MKRRIWMAPWLSSATCQTAARTSAKVIGCHRCLRRQLLSFTYSIIADDGWDHQVFVCSIEKGVGRIWCALASCSSVISKGRSVFHSGSHSTRHARSANKGSSDCSMISCRTFFPVVPRKRSAFPTLLHPQRASSRREPVPYCLNMRQTPSNACSAACRVRSPLLPGTQLCGPARPRRDRLEPPAAHPSLLRRLQSPPARTGQARGCRDLGRFLPGGTGSPLQVRSRDVLGGLRAEQRHAGSLGFGGASSPGPLRRSPFCRWLA